MKISRVLSLFTIGGALVALAGVGCSSDPDETGPTGGAGGSGGDGGNTTTSSTTSTDTTTTSSTTTTTSTDESTSCADAIAMGEYPDNPDFPGVWAEGFLNPGGDRDFFTFTANEGDWFAIFTSADPDDEAGFVDTVITLWNEDGSVQLAEVDDAYPRFSKDTEFYYRAPSTGTYCMQVWEWSDWAGESPLGDPTFYYQLFAMTVDFENLAGWTLDEDDNDDAANAQTPLNLDDGFTRIAGMLDPQADSDWYVLEPEAGDVAVYTYHMPDGVGGFPDSGMGSTQGPDLVNIWYDDGSNLHLWGQVDHALGTDGLSLPLPAGNSNTYFLEVTRPDTAVGANDFYLIKNFHSDADNQMEVDENNNGVLASAEVAVPSNLSHYVMGDSGASDVDYWAFDAGAGQVVTLACGASRSGSGLEGLTVAIHDDSDTELQTETEVDADDILWTTGYPDYGSMAAVAISTTATYYLRVSATGQDANVESAFYRCGIHIGTP